MCVLVCVGVCVCACIMHVCADALIADLAVESGLNPQQVCICVCVDVCWRVCVCVCLSCLCARMQ